MDSHSQATYSTAGALDEPQGRTVITETAVAKVVGIAVRAVPGVHAVGSGTSRSIGALREVVGAADLTQGVRVEVGDSQVAVDLILVAEYGFPLQTLAGTVRAAVYSAVEELVGRGVIEVNIEITDVFIPGAEHEKAPQRGRNAERLAKQGRPFAAPTPPAAAAAEPSTLLVAETAAPLVDYNNPGEVKEQL